MTFEILEHVTAAEPVARAEQSMVRMRDGVRLATDVYLPPVPGRHGVVLIRGPYDKNSRYQGLADMAEVFNDRGLVLVAQDVRGKFRSEGVTHPYVSDVADAYDTLDWIIGQSWSNGSVGLVGVSYLGFTVWAGIASGHPAVKGAVPQGTGVNMARHHLGSPWRQDPAPLLGADDLLQIWADNDIRYLSIDYTRAPLIDTFEEAARSIGVRPPALDDYFRRVRTGDVFNPYGDRHPYWTTNVPVLHWSNWFDPGLGPEGLHDFRYFRGAGGRRGLHYLRAESADHGGVRLEDIPYADQQHPWVNDAEHTQVQYRQAIDAADFLLPLLTGRGSLPSPSQRVRWHTGHAGWRTAEDWPPAGVVHRNLFLSAADSALDGSEGGALSHHQDTERATVSWEHDPASPVPSSVTHDEWWTFLASYPDERDFGSRSDVVTFTSEPTPTALDIAGNAVLNVRAATSGPSMHLFAKLLDVAPDGSARPVSHGRTLLERPDLEDLISFELDAVAYRVRPGHRLRLHLASSDYPLWVRHPGTDENPWHAELFEVNHQRLLLGGLDASHLRLPIYPDSGDEGLRL